MMTSMQAVSGAGRSPGVLGAGHPRQHRPVHPEGRREGREGDPEDPRHALGRRHRRRADGGVVHLHARQRARGPHRVGVRRAEEEGERRRGQGGDGASSAASSSELGLPSAPKHLITVSDDPYPAAAAPRSRRRGRHDDRRSAGCARSRCCERREVHAGVAQHAHGRGQGRASSSPSTSCTRGTLGSSSG